MLRARVVALDERARQAGRGARAGRACCSGLGTRGETDGGCCPARAVAPGRQPASRHLRQKTFLLADSRASLYAWKMQMRRSSLFTSTVVISVTLLSACTGADLLAEPTVTRTIPADDPPPSGSSSIYFHPLQGIEDIDGLYPIADLQDSPEGRRYGVEVWSQFNEDGTAVYGGGLVEYEYEIVTATERAVLALSKETRPALPPRERVGASLLALMDTGAPSTVVEVDVFLEDGAEGRAAAAAVDRFLMGETALPAPIKPTAAPQR